MPTFILREGICGLCGYTEYWPPWYYGPISDNLGNDNSETIVGNITFGTVSVTTAGHALTAIKGVIAGDQVKTNLDGEYKVTFTVPVDATLVSGAYTVEIGEKKRDFLLTGPVQDAVNGQVGTALKISGKFGPSNQRGGTITFSNTTITVADHTLKTIKGYVADDNSVYSDSTGEYEISFEIPDHVNGPVIIQLGASQFGFNVLPSVTLSSQKVVKYGDTITLNGRGFKVLDTLTVTVGDQQVTLPGGTTVDAVGKFTANIQILDSRWQATHDIIVSANASGSRIELDNALIIEPSIVVTPTGGTSNDTVTVSGHNFAGVGTSDDEIVYIDFGQTRPIMEIRKADFGGQPPGSFRATFVTGDQSLGGLLEVRARGSKSTPDATASFLYSHPDSNQNLQIETPVTGYTPGSTLTVVGTGYPKSADIGSITLKSAAGNLVVVTINNYIYGQDAGNSSTQVKTDADGKFKTAVSLPTTIAAGQYQVLMNLEDVNANGILDAGEDTNNNGQLDYHQNYQTISVIPKLTIAAGQSGKIGDTFTVSGVGFASSENVDIKLTDDNVELAAGTFPTDANGKFSSSTFTINQQTFGAKKILAIGRNSSLTAVGDQTISVLNQISKCESNNWQ